MMQRLWRRNIDEWWQMFNSWVPSGYKHPSVPSHHKWWGNNKQRTLFFSAVFPKCIMELLRCYGCKLPLILLSLSLSLFLSPSLSLFHTSIHSHTRKSENWVLYKRNKTNSRRKTPGTLIIPGFIDGSQSNDVSAPSKGFKVNFKNSRYEFIRVCVQTTSRNR